MVMEGGHPGVLFCRLAILGEAVRATGMGMLPVVRAVWWSRGCRELSASQGGWFMSLSLRVLGGAMFAGWVGVRGW